jgi:hypothetical protein
VLTWGNGLRLCSLQPDLFHVPSDRAARQPEGEQPADGLGRVPLERLALHKLQPHPADLGTLLHGALYGLRVTRHGHDTTELHVTMGGCGHVRASGTSAVLTGSMITPAVVVRVMTISAGRKRVDALAGILPRIQ